MGHSKKIIPLTPHKTRIARHCPNTPLPMNFPVGEIPLTCPPKGNVWAVGRK